jgi:hypothetical protein
MLTKCAVTLIPVLGIKSPEVVVSVPGTSQRHSLDTVKRIELEFTASNGWIEILFDNKPQSDHSMAVIVDQIEFFGIANSKFVWAGVYTPDYPEPWLSQQAIKPADKLLQHNYLGWNGCWRLDFDVPVFTWIHRTLNLGWLYQ